MKEKHHGIAIITIIGLIIALIVVSIGNKNTGIEPTKNTLSVSGNAELTVAPDQAILYVTILTEGSTAKEAQDENKVTANKVIDVLKKSGIKNEDIETDNYYLAKKTEWDPALQKVVDKGYMLTHTLKVTTTKIDKAGNLVGSAVNAGANGVERISFGLTKETEKKVRDEALMKASENAKGKAESITKALGVRLGKISSIQESNFYYTPYEYARASGLEKAVMAEEIQIQPQKVEVMSNINLIFEIN